MSNVVKIGVIVQNYELAVVALNVVIIAVAYFSVYPKLAGYDINKVAWYDLVSSTLAIIIVGYKYWGTGQEFELLFWQVNWFWFTFISYLLVEIPVAIWYFRRLLFNKSD